MNLPFSTVWPEKMGDLAKTPTNFIEKIWGSNNVFSDAHHKEYFEDGLMDECYEFEFEIMNSIQPKIHTIRKGNRWKPGMMIDFWINYGTKNQFRFAPRIPATQVYQLDIIKQKGKNWDSFSIYIDGSLFTDPIIFEMGGNGMPYVEMTNEAKKITQNDGFDSVGHFFRWFSEDFKGQIIHWTDYKY